MVYMQRIAVASGQSSDSTCKNLGVDDATKSCMQGLGMADALDDHPTIHKPKQNPLIH